MAYQFAPGAQNSLVNGQYVNSDPSQMNSAVMGSFNPNQGGLGQAGYSSDPLANYVDPAGVAARQAAAQNASFSNSFGPGMQQKSAVQSPGGSSGGMSGKGGAQSMAAPNSGSPGAGPGASGKGGAQSMPAPSAQNSLAGGKAASYGPGMWGQSANGGLMFGLGGQPPPGWNAANIQGGPLPGQQAATPPGVPIPPGWATGLPGQSPNMPGAPNGSAPPGWNSTLTPGTQTAAPVIPPKTPVGGVTPNPPGGSMASGVTSAPGSNGPPAGAGTATAPKSAVQGAPSAGGLSFGGSGTQPYATAFSTATQSQTPAGQSFLANLSKYGAGAAANYLGSPQSFSVNDFNKAAGANPALATQMLAAGGQQYRDAVAKANGWSPAQMNQFINTNGSGQLSGFTPQALAQLKGLGVG
jgi:hypothetical protein